MKAQKNALKKAAVVTIFLLMMLGCNLPSGSNDGNDTHSLLTSDYFNANSGFSIRYSVTTPANMSLSGDRPTKLWLTFQNSLSNKVAFVSSDIQSSNGNHSACCYFSIGPSEASFKGGAIWGIASIPFQKIHLPGTLQFSNSSLVINESTAWYGIGTYSITYGVTTGGFTDCIRIDFSSAKLNFTNQKGHGSYWLAKNIGLVRYEATLDESGTLGNSGETFIIVYENSQTVTQKSVIGSVLDSGGAPIQGKHITFGQMTGLYNEITDAAGGFSIPLFYVDQQNLPPINVCDLDATNIPINSKSVPIPTCASTDINIGNITYP